MADWVEKLCNMAFESCSALKNWRNIVIVPLYIDKGERTECKNCRAIILLSVSRKIYAGLLIVYRVIKGLVDNEQGGFRPGRGLCR